MSEDQAFVDYTSGYLYENDQFYLCSDGINKVYNNEQLSQQLQKNLVIERLNQNIVNAAVNHHAPDNLSSIIVQL